MNETKQFSISQEQYEKLNELLLSFLKNSNSSHAMLSDLSGTTITTTGGEDRQRMMMLSSLAAGSYASNSAMARLLNENTDKCGHLHEGSMKNIYLKGVGDTFIFTVVYENKLPFEMISMLADKIVKELNSIVSNLTSSSKNSKVKTPERKTVLENEKAEDELNIELDMLMGEL
jgi:predicted regulator of Ras-like GTPase activity (Roadblock/LC7/MglB family)